MINTLKTSLLENYSLIEELFTMKVFNRAICNLAAKGVVFSTQEFTKYKVLETLGQFIEKSQIELFTVKLRMAMVWLGKGNQENKAMCQETLWLTQIDKIIKLLNLKNFKLITFSNSSKVKNII